MASARKGYNTTKNFAGLPLTGPCWADIIGSIDWALSGKHETVSRQYVASNRPGMVSVPGNAVAGIRIHTGKPDSYRVQCWECRNVEGNRIVVDPYIPQRAGIKADSHFPLEVDKCVA